MTMVEEMTHQQSETARVIYEKRGVLRPQVWAQGLTGMMIAEPITDRAGASLDDQRMATLLTAMAVRVDALTIGRTDQVYYRQSEKPIYTGNLRALLDIDPEIRTCVVTEAVGVGGSEEILVVAIHHRDDDGSHQWEILQGSTIEGRSAIPLRTSRDLLDEGLPDYWRDPIALRQYANQIGWIIRSFPDDLS
jgi:hypothetical protein